MIALIDGDVVVYRVGFASENQTETQNCMNTELVMDQIMSDTHADTCKVYLSDSLENNYRFKIDPEYKANRKDARRPRWYQSIKSFLKNKYGAEITTGQEADDALGIKQAEHNYLAVDKEFPEYKPTIICSIDKDLLQIPGLHYSITKREITTVQHIDGIRHFYAQLLIGDRVDNIRGIDGIGPVKAGRLLDSIVDETQMFGRVRDTYNDDERLLKNGQLLWIRRQEGDEWKFPTGDNNAKA